MWIFYWVHAWDRLTPLDETMRVLDEIYLPRGLANAI